MLGEQAGVASCEFFFELEMLRCVGSHWGKCVLRVRFDTSVLSCMMSMVCGRGAHWAMITSVHRHHRHHHRAAAPQYAPLLSGSPHQKHQVRVCGPWVVACVSPCAFLRMLLVPGPFCRLPCISALHDVHELLLCATHGFSPPHSIYLLQRVNQRTLGCADPHVHYTSINFPSAGAQDGRSWKYNGLLLELSVTVHHTLPLPG